MKWIKFLFHFLGGLYFAIFLIAITAGIVILGTFLEAYADSHLYASQMTYSHPLFALLLGSFFINILFAALRRWPFKLRHIPFLITHLGLLMVIAGCIIKSWYGTQGNLLIAEGSASQKITVPHTYALHVEKRESIDPAQRTLVQIPLPLHKKSSHLPFSDLQIRVIGSTPHVSEKLETWIKGNRAYVSGVPPFDVQEWKPSQPLIIARQAKLQPQTTWDLIALRTNDMQSAIEHAYLYHLNIHMEQSQNQVEKIEIPLQQALNTPLSINEDAVQLSLHMPYSPILGFEHPALKVSCASGPLVEQLKISLQGQEALYPLMQSPYWKKSPRYQIDLKRPRPLLLLLQDQYADSYVFAFDCHGRVHGEAFHPGLLHSLAAYDQGFGGYTAQATLPYPNFSTGRAEKERANLYFLSIQLQKAMQTNPQLSSPLNWLKDACEKAQVAFIPTLLDFLQLWQQSQALLIPLDTPLTEPIRAALQVMDWEQISLKEQQGCQGVCLFFDRLQEPLKEGKDLLTFLRHNKWPLINQLQADKPDELLNELAQQMFALSGSLPALRKQQELSIASTAHLFSAYLKAYGIELHTIQPPLEEGPEDFQHLFAYEKSQSQISMNEDPLIIETPLTAKHLPQKPSNQIENLCPQVFLECKKGNQKQLISLAYDTTGSGLKWPFLQGMFLIRFQARDQTIPYRVRLHQARQLNYAQTNQPFSYESDIVITGSDNMPIRKTLSMNHVHETWDGYRFYLAGMTTSESGLKRVQLVVNYDPAKYYLTYPGGLITVLGISLLFWMQPYRRKKM